MSENLKRHRPDIKVLGEGHAIAFMPEDPMGVWVHIQEVRDLLDVKDKEIAKLKERYKDMDVTHTVHIAKMNARIEELEDNEDFWGKENRRLKRALWIARAELSHRLDVDGYLRKHTNSWYHEDYFTWNEACVAMEVAMREIESKCRAKAEEYK